MSISTFTRNNLDATASPYLLQHRDNPVWWQPWTQEVLDYAGQEGKPILVSVGYATCHWCHVMAAGAFSHEGVAAKLNREFVSIKVDREERPDLDHYLMQFMLATRGQGGWPLNVFLTSEGHPFFAMTYAPVEARGGMPAFTEVLDRIAAFHRTETDRVKPFNLPFTTPESGTDGAGASDTGASSTSASDGEASAGGNGHPGGNRAEPIARAALHRAHNLVRRSDRTHGGFGRGPKFPPHSSLLYLLHVQELYRDEAVEPMLRRTLNAIARRGLQDHLQGGFFRYCVDEAWTIPHFEKMLYDQAMLLWVYSLAYKVFDELWYRQVADDVVRALEETFSDEDRLYRSAHDADTEHQEGATYVWSDEDLEELTPETRGRMTALFEIEPGGNFEGSYHLVRRDDGPLDEGDRRAMTELLEQRRTRPQPDVDDKIVTAWNALAGIALVQAGRHLRREDLMKLARRLYTALEKKNRRADRRWVRSSRGGVHGPVECLEDYAALLYLVTLLAEHSRDATEFREWSAEMEELEERIREFRYDGGWLYTLAGDVPPVPADTFDSPTPSPRALAETALIRSSQLRGTPPPPALTMGADYQEDFHNLAVLIQEGEFYLLERPEPLAWDDLPANTMQHRGPRETWCYRGACRPGLPPEWNPEPEEL